MEHANVIAAHQVEISARLEADEFFSDIQVFYERQGNFAGKLDEVLKGMRRKNDRIGAAVMVGVVRAVAENPDVPGPWLNQMTCDVTAFEHVVLNSGSVGTKKACVDIIIRVLQVIHHYIPLGIGGVITAARDAILPLGEVQPGVIAYKATLRLNPECDVLTKVETPVIEPRSGPVPTTVTITCATPGAAIYLSTDGSYPSPVNEQAVLYTIPLSISVATRLRAVAYLAGTVASDSAVGEYT